MNDAPAATGPALARSNAWLGVRLSQAEHQAIKRKAASHGLSMSEYVRRKCLEESNGPVIETDIELLKRIYRDQRRIGGLANQIARHANHRRQDFPELAAQAEKTLEDISRSSQEISKFIQDARNGI